MMKNDGVQSRNRTKLLWNINRFGFKRFKVQRAKRERESDHLEIGVTLSSTNGKTRDQTRPSLHFTFQKMLHQPPHPSPITPPMFFRFTQFSLPSLHCRRLIAFYNTPMCTLPLALHRLFTHYIHLTCGKMSWPAGFKIQDL